jgi:hypothetical protein
VQIPDHYLRRPDTWGASDVAAFEQLFAEYVAPRAGARIQYGIAAPKWQFLCWMTEYKNLVLHGGNGATVDTLEPRQADDVSEFGARNAVYAASDGIWPMYFAIADRTVVTSLVNACIHLDDDQVETKYYYYFSINENAMTSQPWVTGNVYVLSRDTFQPEAEDTWLGRPCMPTQWASHVPVRPMATLAVTPGDFPFLKQVRSHDQQAVSDRAAQDPDNFPWLNEA